MLNDTGRDKRKEEAASVTLITKELLEKYQDFGGNLDIRREELRLLIDTAGGVVKREFTQSRSTPDPATFVGKGKAEEIRDTVESMGLELVVFNHELSPSQQSNLEEIIPCRIVDRTRLILDIFAQRANSKEGKLQVELAQLAYLLPRLTGLGEELSRLAGGIGTRGPGETKLETDRRRVRRRMTDIRNEIENVREHRKLQRDRRSQKAIPIFALVGYTNAGKSTLLNRLTGSDQLVEDQLFATLDPTTRKLDLPHSIEACVVDTVGFVRDLPEQLMTAFRATLEEVTEADFLVHVMDVSHPNWLDQTRTVTSILDDLGVLDLETITVLNKIDLIDNLDWEQIRRFTRPVNLSAYTGEGIDELKRQMASLVEQRRVQETFEVPYSQMEIIDELHSNGEIHEEEYLESGVKVKVTLDKVLADRTHQQLNKN